MRTSTILGAALMTLTLTTGCGDGVQTPLGLVVDRPPGQNGMALQVSDRSGSASPTYLWSGENARRLTVRRVSTGDVYWDVRATDVEAGFGSPVEHGIQPIGASIAVSDRLLIADEPFAVEVQGVNGGTGRLEFTPAAPSG